MSYLYVKWNSFGRGLLAEVAAIKACLRALLATHGTKACDAVGGALRP